MKILDYSRKAMPSKKGKYSILALGIAMCIVVVSFSTSMRERKSRPGNPQGPIFRDTSTLLRLHTSRIIAFEKKAGRLPTKSEFNLLQQEVLSNNHNLKSMPVHYYLGERGRLVHAVIVAVPIDWNSAIVILDVDGTVDIEARPTERNRIRNIVQDMQLNK